MTNYRACISTSSNQIRGKPTYKKARPNVKLEDLPQDVLCTILSKLPAKEISRASVLSRDWRYVPDICCYKLCFASAAGCCRDSFPRKEYCQYMQKFISDVNAVVRNSHGKVVEEFNVKFEFDIMLLAHLNNWVDLLCHHRQRTLLSTYVLLTRQFGMLAVTYFHFTSWILKAYHV
ncbi:hypothetical protein VPH35_060302 [Triticum aestivum]